MSRNTAGIPDVHPRPAPQTAIASVAFRGWRRQSRAQRGTTMDGSRFEAFLRGMTQEPTRRGAFRFIGGAVLGGLLSTSVRANQTAAKKKGKPGKKKKKKAAATCIEIGASCLVCSARFCSDCCSGYCDFFKTDNCCAGEGQPCPSGCLPDKPCDNCCRFHYCAANGTCA